MLSVGDDRKRTRWPSSCRLVSGPRGRSFLGLRLRCVAWLLPFPALSAVTIWPPIWMQEWKECRTLFPSCSQLSTWHVRVGAKESAELGSSQTMGKAGFVGSRPHPLDYRGAARDDCGGLPTSFPEEKPRVPRPHSGVPFLLDGCCVTVSLFSPPNWCCLDPRTWPQLSHHGAQRKCAVFFSAPFPLRIRVAYGVGKTPIYQ